jgi:hypothetical protein
VASDLFHSLIAEFAKVIAPLRDAPEDPDRLESLLAQVGATSDSAGGDPLAAALAAVVALADRAQELDAEPSPAFGSIAVLLEGIRNAVLAMRALSEASGPAAALETFGVDLLEWLILRYLWNYHPQAYNIAVLATLITPAEDTTPRPPILDGDTVKRMPFQQARFRFDRLKLLFTDPLAALKAEYGTPLLTVADANAMADKLFPRVLRVLRGFDVPVSYGFNPIHAKLLGDSASFVDRALIVYTADTMMDAEVEAGVVISLSSADRGDLGFVFNPFGTLAETWDLGKWKLELDLTAQVQGFAVGRHGFTLSADASVATVGGKFTATLAAPDQGPAYVVGSPAGTRLEIGGAEFDLETTLSEVEQTLAASAAVSKSVLVVQSADGDGFLRSILPADGLKAQFDLGIAWSDKTGFSFHGAAGLDATLPVGISIGGVLTVPTIHLGLYVNDAGLQAEVSASIALSLGPVHALVDRVGIMTLVTFPESGGNLGVADLSFGFKPPSGVGLAIDVAGLTGGGFLDRDDTKQEYAGVLQLDFYSYKLTAFGLLATVLPTGPGYSFIAMVDAEFPAIELGLGFALTGAGGLIGLHRVGNVEALRAGLAAHTLSNLLFPKNPIANAPQLLTELDTLFPGADGRLIFGPIVRIEWGVPALLTLELALILELPDPVRLVLIAELAVLLPEPQDKLVELHVSALGTVDFGKSEGALDAILHDSRLMNFPLHGAMALRVDWAGQKTFVLAVGGVHPKFQPPPTFPKLDRVGISLASGHISKLNLDGYLAVTSNSLQIGAHIDLFVGIDEFGIFGYLAFDSLIQRHPFHFDADISGGVALRVHGHDVMALQLSASLSGPAPWHAAGSVKFHLLFLTVHKSFSETFGDADTAPMLDKVDVGQLLRTALSDAQNFAALAPGTAALVSLAKPAAGPTQVLAHPGASLTVHQTVVPLGLTITQYGGAEPLRETRFDITSVSADGVALPVGPAASTASASITPVLDDFAPAQFLTLSDDDKLASPSFERLASGIELAGPTIFGAPFPKTVIYETWFVDSPDGPPRGPSPEEGTQPSPFPLGVLIGVLSGGAAGLAILANTGTQRYAGRRHPMMPAELDFVVATSDQLAHSGVGAAAGLSYSQARAALDGELALRPERRTGLLVTPRYEVAA